MLYMCMCGHSYRLYIHTFYAIDARSKKRDVFARVVTFIIRSAAILLFVVARLHMYICIYADIYILQKLCLRTRKCARVLILIIIITFIIMTLDLVMLSECFYARLCSASM